MNYPYEKCASDPREVLAKEKVDGVVLLVMVLEFSHAVMAKMMWSSVFCFAFLFACN